MVPARIRRRPKMRRRVRARADRRTKGFVDAAGTVAFKHLDDFPVTLDIATLGKFGDCLDDCFHLGEQERSLEFVESGAIALGSRLSFRTQQMGEAEAGNEASLTTAARLRLDGDADLPPSVLRQPTVDRLHEFTLTWQQLHLRAGQDSFRNWQELQKCNHALNARQALFLPWQRARS